MNTIKPSIMKKIFLLLTMGFMLNSCGPQENPDPPTSKPTVTTGQITGITATTATCSENNVTADGGATVTIRGVCWSTASNPTIEDSKTEDSIGTKAGTGTFTSNLTGLTPNTIYYVRAYATNSQGTAYGEQRVFTTYGTFSDSRDGKVYKTVTIGEQTWLAENLAYLPVVYPSNIGSSSALYYVNDYYGYDINEAIITTNYQIYGALYNWPAALVACPIGWHLPSDYEWNELVDYLGGEDVAGGKLKSTGITHWISPNEGATDESNFRALPGGAKGVDGIHAIGYASYFWSSTEYSNLQSWYRALFYTKKEAYRDKTEKNNAVSVRCVLGSTKPIVNTKDVINISITSATCLGDVLSNGGSTVTSRGICWSVNENPTVADSKIEEAAGLGEFRMNLINLFSNTKYYVRAYAINSEGIAYGEQINFTTQQESEFEQGVFTDDRDGREYNYLTIGTQVWMTENLAYLPSVVGPATESTTDPCYYVYGYNGTDVTGAKAIANYTTYGVLYNWSAALTACPPGWHLPSDLEWYILENFVDNSINDPAAYSWRGIDCGKKLKSITQWMYDAVHFGTNNFGFSALPGGLRNGGGDGSFLFRGTIGDWWSSSAHGKDAGLFREMQHDNSKVARAGYSRTQGLSVRCLRD